MSNLTFSDIIKEGWEHFQSSSFSVSTNNNDERINADEIKQNISIIATMVAQGHAGYNTFDKNSKELFEGRIEKLYNNAPIVAKPSNLMKVINSTLKALPDKHLVLSDSKGNNPFYEAIQGNVGENIAQSANKRYELLETQKDGKNIGIISLPIAGITDTNQLKIFAKDLKTHIFNAGGDEKFDSLIIDIRGNQGGSALSFEYLARTIYGNEVANCETSSYRDTKQADMIRHINGELSKSDFAKRLKDNAYSGENITTFNTINHREDYPAFVNGGYKKPIIVLIDSNTASAAESIYPMLKDHPGVTFIGEKSSGCYTEVSGENSLPLPCGYKIKIATKHLSMPKEFGNTETIGFVPNIETKGIDAFEYTLKNINIINKVSQNKINRFAQNKNIGLRIDKKQISTIDDQYLRGLNSGLEESFVKNLFISLNPEEGKEQKWDYIAKQSNISKNIQTFNQTQLNK